MKRKITELEQRLIDKGYYLSHKQYSGRKSEKTLSYTYVNKNAFVKLDFKRENVVSYGLLNYSAMELTRMEWQGIDILLNMIKNDIGETREPRKIEPLLNRPTKIILGNDISDEKKEKLIKELNEPDKVVFCPNSEYDEREELGSMTFEQFDELCQEKENDKCH